MDTQMDTRWYMITDRGALTAGKADCCMPTGASSRPPIPISTLILYGSFAASPPLEPSGPYFGQDPSDRIPEIVAPGGRVDIYWVDASVPENLRQQER